MTLENEIRKVLMFLVSVLSAVLAIQVVAVDSPPDVPGVQLACNTVPDCLQLLRSDDPKIKGGAIATLGALKDPRAVPHLIGIVQQHVYGNDVYFYQDTPTSHAVVTAMRALGAIGDRKALPVLMDFIINERFIQYRVLAAEMIRMIGVDRENISSLLKLLNDSHSSLRFIVFETIRFADDPVSKLYTKRLVHFIPRADMIEDSVTSLPHLEPIGLHVYPDAVYLFYASASERWIMRERPIGLRKVHWLHTFLTKEPLKRVVAYYEDVHDQKVKPLNRSERQYVFAEEEGFQEEMFGKIFGFIVNSGQRGDINSPEVIVSLYEDRVLDGTAITISAPK
jgi:hypothetical protein